MVNILKFLLDEDNYIIGIGDYMDTITYIGDIPDGFFNKINCYKLENGELVLDEKRLKNQEK